MFQLLLCSSVPLWPKKSNGPAEWEGSGRVCGLQKPVEAWPWFTDVWLFLWRGTRWALGSFPPRLATCDQPGWGGKMGPTTFNRSTHISDVGKSGCGQRELVCGCIVFPPERTEGCHRHLSPGPWELPGLHGMKLKDSGLWSQVLGLECRCQHLLLV